MEGNQHQTIQGSGGFCPGQSPEDPCSDRGWSGSYLGIQLKVNGLLVYQPDPITLIYQYLGPGVFDQRTTITPLPEETFNMEICEELVVYIKSEVSVLTLGEFQNAHTWDNVELFVEVLP